MRGYFTSLAIVFVCAACAAHPVAAREDFGRPEYGLRVGLSADPDQLVMGGHLALPIYERSLVFAPNVTLGFGDDLFLVALSPDLLYRLPAGDLGDVYFGGIFVLQFLNYDTGGRGERRYADDTDTELGVHAIAGLELSGGPIFIEAAIGIDDAPDVKGVVGYTFR